MRIVLPAALRHAVKKALLGAGVRRETIQRVAEFWDGVDTATCAEYWGNFPMVRRAINARVAGSPDTTWFTRQILARTGRFGRVLTFGDGYGMAAEAYQRRHDTDEIVYLNVSSGEGRRFAQRLADVDYRGARAFVQGDANTLDYLSLGMFDTIIDVGTFHHLFAFELIFPQLHRILKPGGILYVDEFVGPTRYHFTRPVIDWVNRQLRDLPASLVKSRRRVRQGDYVEMLTGGNDPSECVRSGELQRALLDAFRVLSVDDMGGTLLQPLFLTSNLRQCRLNIGNWHETPDGEAELARLVAEETEWIRTGRVSSDYRNYVFTRRSK